MENGELGLVYHARSVGLRRCMRPGLDVPPPAFSRDFLTKRWAGHGALYDMGVHGLTMTTGILGPAKAVGCMAKISEPVRTVRTGTFDGMQIQADQLYDNYIITLDYGERTMAVVESGFCQKDSRAPQIQRERSLSSTTVT